MPVLNKKYDKLVLSDIYITDPLLMALAWKKSHDYIRTTSWYADNFELDVSSVDLSNRCNEWIGELTGELKFRPLELVPAPKSHAWEFKKPPDQMGRAEFKIVWQPSKSDKQENSEYGGNESDALDLLKLRPLAHIGIREQSTMTLVMMCLANEVETQQGDPSTGYELVHERGVVSYGNRLYCRYENGKAEHSYGATATYSKYFTDYRKFLERPYFFARKELQEKTEEEEVYLLELDLSKFFDRVNRVKLIEKIEDLMKYQSLDKEIDSPVVENILNAFRNWDWSTAAKIDFEKLCSSENVKEAPLGLPQGLVASGFLANIYLAEFDHFMQSLIGKIVCESSKIKLIDYCRYVDDMRIVLLGGNRESLERLHQEDELKGADHLEIVKSAIFEKIDPILANLNLEANEKKTKIEIFRGKSIGISRTLEDIQSNVSGPISHEDAEIHLGQLESLLALSSVPQEDQSGGTGRFNRLAAIEKDIFDVREDTMKRFAANKIASLLNNIRHFTARETHDDGSPKPGDWDFLQERLARRFIACWSKDPALVLLLKKGLELFPSSNLLEPVLEQLRYLITLQFDFFSDIDPVQKQRQAALGRYCLAEVFRHSATIIHRKDLQAIPAHADVNGFFELLQSHAVKIISPKFLGIASADSGDTRYSSIRLPSERHEFDFLGAQARFLLLVRLDTALESSSGCVFHDFIFKLAKGFRAITLPADLSDRDIAAGILVARQLLDDPKPLLRATASLLESQPKSLKVLELIAMQDAITFRSLILHARPLRFTWLDEDGVPELVDKLYIGIRPSVKTLADIKSKISLYKLISRPDNPFGNEIMALKLMLKLLQQSTEFINAEEGDVIDLAKTLVSFPEFSATPEFAVFDAKLELSIEFNSSLAEAAKHLHFEHEDTFILQRVALCLRAALAGSGDPTGFGQSLAPRAGYRGLKSTRYKRQIGLLTTPESLIGEAAQFSTWLTTLLSKLLKWPGIRVNNHGFEWPLDLTIENVTRLVEERLEKLRESYCQHSRMPSLHELVTPNWGADKTSLIVAMVQTKMAQEKDFGEIGLFLDDAEYRVRHRRHLARIAKLVTKHIEAQHISKPMNGEREQDIDLIVLPELAVHYDDMDVLIHLSRKTHAIIVAGLGFINQSNLKGPNNCAIWIVPKKHNGNQNEILRLQGKQHLTPHEKLMKVQPWRPYQLMLELAHPSFPNVSGFVLTASICFDSTDIALSADLRDKSNALLIPALNRDVNTFDSMVEALHYHMYQHVVLVNTGEYGGSYAMAPYEERHKRLIAHSSGNDQVTINTFKMNMFDFRRDGVGSSMRSGIKQKAAPAGVSIL